MESVHQGFFFCAKALPAALFDVLPVLPLCSTLEAASAACLLVLRPLFTCDKALPAADLESLLVRPSRNVLEAAVAAFAPVFFSGILPSKMVEILQLNRCLGTAPTNISKAISHCTHDFHKLKRHT